MASADSLWGMAWFFLVIIGLLVGLYVWNIVSDDAQIQQQLFGQTDQGTNVKSRVGSYFDKTDSIGFFAFFAIHIGIIISAWKLRTHPIMYLIGFLLIMVMVLIAPVFSNTYTDVMASDGLSDVSAEVPNTTLLMENFPKWEVIMSALTAIILFGLARYEGFV